MSARKERRCFPTNDVAEPVPGFRAVAVVHSNAHSSAQFCPFCVISKLTRWKLWRASREINENAVARQLSIVFKKHLQGNIFEKT